MEYALIFFHIPVKVTWERWNANFISFLLVEHLKTFLLLCVAIGEFFLQLERGWGRVGLTRSGILTLPDNLYWNSPYVFLYI